MHLKVCVSQVDHSMFCRLALPKDRTLTADDEVIVCSWQRVTAPAIVYLTCNVAFTIDIVPAQPGTQWVTLTFDLAFRSAIR